MSAGAGFGVQRLGRVAGPLAYVLIALTPGFGLDPLQRQVAAVTAWTAIWWITAALPVGAASLLPAVLFPLGGVMSASHVAPLYMNDLVLLFVGAFVVALGLERWNVHRRMALAIVSRIGTQPRRLVLGFMVASAFLSCFINNTSTTLLMLPIGMACVESVEGVRGSRSPFAMALLLGMAYSASVGGTATPVGTTPNQVFLGIFRDRYPAGPEISFGEWTLAWGPLVLVYLPLGWWLLTRVSFRVSSEAGTATEALRVEREKLGPMSAAEKRMAGVFALTALLWVTRAPLQLGSLRLPGWGELFPVDERGKGFVSDATVATAVAILTFVLPSGDGSRLMDWKTARRLPWEVLLLIGGGFALAGAFRESGLDRAVGEAIGPSLGVLPEWGVVLLVVVLVASLTEVTSNTATTAVLLPVLGQAALSAGLSPLFTMLPATVAASAAFMLPVATPPNAVVFSSRLVPAPTMARAGFAMNVLLVVLVTGVFHAWVRPVLGIEAGRPAWSAAAPQAPGPGDR